jgi:hypothetical protein
MKKVTVCRCPVGGMIRQYAARVADEVRKQVGAPVEVVDGSPGDLTVTVGRYEVFRRREQLPDVNRIVEIVRTAEPTRRQGSTP